MDLRIFSPSARSGFVLPTYDGWSPSTSGSVVGPLNTDLDDVGLGLVLDAPLQPASELSQRGIVSK